MQEFSLRVPFNSTSDVQSLCTQIPCYKLRKVRVENSRAIQIKFQASIQGSQLIIKRLDQYIQQNQTLGQESLSYETVQVFLQQPYSQHPQMTEQIFIDYLIPDLPQQYNAKKDQKEEKSPIQEEASEEKSIPKRENDNSTEEPKFSASQEYSPEKEIKKHFHNDIKTKNSLSQQERLKLTQLLLTWEKLEQPFYGQGSFQEQQKSETNQNQESPKEQELLQKQEPPKQQLPLNYESSESIQSNFEQIPLTVTEETSYQPEESESLPKDENFSNQSVQIDDDLSEEQLESDSSSKESLSFYEASFSTFDWHSIIISSALVLSVGYVVFKFVL